MSTNPPPPLCLSEHGLVFLGYEGSRAARHVEFRSASGPGPFFHGREETSRVRKCPTISWALRDHPGQKRGLVPTGWAFADDPARRPPWNQFLIPPKRRSRNEAAPTNPVARLHPPHCRCRYAGSLTEEDAHEGSPGSTQEHEVRVGS
ncbi:uncharacterized protein PG986_012491 [Apiospora aurea]|uniref:Uncharacterized protein n=1 Tax=Apiospora aurea TaxID=335848 RepID=A0ABR1Q067_9PEZI